jgi:putative ABC transport system permease protein
MGIRLLEGRTFDDLDVTTSEPVVIVNRTFARTYFTGSAVGRRIPVRIEDGRDDWTIAGVVDDVLMRSATEPPQPEIYVSVNQLLRGLSSDPALVIRASTRPEALTATVRTVIRDQDSALALDSVMTMEDRLLGTLARLYAVVLGGFALFALVIAAVGLFGGLSYTVAQRAREIGVRTALGATRADIVRLVVKQGVTVTVAGVLCGVAGAFVLSRWMGTVLYGVTAHDLASFLAMPAVLVVVALAACYVPARRAASIDPLRVLRSG